MSHNHSSVHHQHPLPIAQQPAHPHHKVFPAPHRPFFISYNYSFIDDAISSYSLLQKYKPIRSNKYLINKTNQNKSQSAIMQIFKTQRKPNLPPPTSPHLKYNSLSFYRKHSSIFHNSVLKDKLESPKLEKEDGDLIKFSIRNLPVIRSQCTDAKCNSDSYIKKFLSHKHAIRNRRKHLLENLSGSLAREKSCLLNRCRPSRSHQVSMSGIQVDNSYRFGIYSMLCKIRKKRESAVNKSK